MESGGDEGRCGPIVHTDLIQRSAYNVNLLREMGDKTSIFLSFCFVLFFSKKLFQ